VHLNRPLREIRLGAARTARWLVSAVRRNQGATKLLEGGRADAYSAALAGSNPLQLWLPEPGGSMPYFQKGWRGPQGGFRVINIFISLL